MRAHARASMSANSVQKRSVLTDLIRSDIAFVFVLNASSFALIDHLNDAWCLVPDVHISLSLCVCMRFYLFIFSRIDLCLCVHRTCNRV